MRVEIFSVKYTFDESLLLKFSKNASVTQRCLIGSNSTLFNRVSTFIIGHLNVYYSNSHLFCQEVVG